MLNLLFAFLLAPCAAYCLYMGIKLLLVHPTKYDNLVRLQTSEGLHAGFVTGATINDPRLTHGLEISEDGTQILSQSRFSTSALKAAYPY